MSTSKFCNDFISADRFREQKKYKEAIVFLKNALAIREKLFGSENAAVASTLGNLAVLYAKAGKFEESEARAREGIEIREKLQGAEHPDVAKQLLNLAMAQSNQKKHESAAQSYRRAAEIYEKKHGPAESSTLKAKTQMCTAMLKMGMLKVGG